MQEPFVSVIIPTLNREEVLCNTISFLLSQNYPTFELIVIDQSTSHTIKTEAFLRKHEDSILYKRITHVGTSHAKNVGANLAKGDVLIFCDDDIVPHDNYLLKHHVKNYTDPSIGGVGGRVIVKDNSMSKNLEHIAYVSKAGIFYDNFSLNSRRDIDTVHGCNMSWRRSVFFDVGGFDENFKGNAFREESDLSFRVRKSGYRIVFEPEAEVLHLRTPSGGTRNFSSRIDWYYYLFHNETLFFVKNMRLLYFPLFLLGKIRPILACMFWYGSASPKALITPFRGIYDGLRTYRRGKKSGIY